MASTKFQLEETKKPNPRCVLELHTIRAMIREAERMDEDLRIVPGPQALASDLMNTLQRVIRVQALDSLHAQQSDMPVAQGQRPQNGFASRVGQNHHPPVVGLPQVQAEHNSPLNQSSVNQIPPQRGIPTPQQTFVPSVTAQWSLTQLSPHVFGNGLPFNSALTQIPGALPQPLALTIRCTISRTRSEEQLKALFAQFANTADLRRNDPDLVIDGRPVNL